MEKTNIEKIIVQQQLNRKYWFSENIVPIIAITVIAFCCSVLLIILLRGVKSTDTNTTIILTGTFNILMLILGFYFVSSKSNKGE